MIAVLIFAGKSTRFWPLAEKSLFEIAGTTLLAEQIKRLKQSGFKDHEILLVAGAHNIKQAKKLFPKLPIVEQKDLALGMRGALLSALPRCKKESVLIVSANDVIDTSAYEGLRKRSKGRTEGGLILARKVKHYFPGGYLCVKGKHITGIIEKPGAGKEPSTLVNIVAHVHIDASVLLRTLKAVKPTQDDGYEVALDVLFQKSHYEAVAYAGYWQPVKYPWHLLDLLLELLPKNSKPIIPKSCTVHKTAVIEGSVVLGENVKVFPHATIVGPCFVGRGTIVSNNALVRGSSVGQHCIIGYGTEVARSILADRVWTHMSYVGDSVLGEGTSLGGGTTTGNLRLDEAPVDSFVHGEKISTHRKKLGAIIGAGCRTGIHTGISPGIKIGAGSFIHSAELVTSDVPDHSFLKNGVLRPNRSNCT